jgi:hypothetical protein
MQKWRMRIGEASRRDVATHTHPISENDLTECLVPLRAVSNVKSPFENLFIDLGEHSADKALLALTNAIHAAQRDMNAYEWISSALPGATLKPAFAFGTVGELYRSFSRPAELARLSALRRG